ncbi:roadblock/LC7 domain-containing protein [Micromonospora sp. NPDC006766]|uniref:roadblock/LC7 domain-containing protein n=1 Tax=Micromonospora sp. NPDC006766 TaxID=3154778 RepID=UPI0033FA1135
MQQQNSSRSDLAWLLDDLVSRVKQTQHAVVLSVDGLLMASSAQLGREDAEQLAAIASGIQSLAKGAGRHFGGGPVRQTVIELQSSFLFVTAAGHGACLAVLAAEDADVGLVAYEMAMVVTRAGKYLASPARGDVQLTRR